jgi:hypothetical protein
MSNSSPEREGSSEQAKNERPSVEESSGGNANADRAAETAEPRPGESPAKHKDRLLDEALEETFPASDPISPA